MELKKKIKRTKLVEITVNFFTTKYHNGSKIKYDRKQKGKKVKRLTRKINTKPYLHISKIKNGYLCTYTLRERPRNKNSFYKTKIK